MTTAPCTPKTTTPLFASHASGHPTTTQVKRKKSKVNAISYFLCFRSVDVIVSDKRGRHPKDVVPYVAMGKKEGVFPKVVPLALSLPTSDNEGDDKEKFRPIDQQAKKVRCGFSQVLNAVGLKTALAKKVQKRKPSKSFASTTNESSFTSSYDRNWSQEDVPRISETFAVEEKEGVVLPKVSPTASRVLGHEGEDNDRHNWRNKGRHKLSRIFNAILFETYLAKKLQKSTKGKTVGRKESPFFEEDDPIMASDSTASSVTNVSVFTTSSLNSSGSLSRTSSSTTRSLSKRLKSFRSRSTRSFKNNLRYLSDKFRSNSNRSSRPNSRSSSGKNKWFESNLSNGLKEEQGQDQSDVMSIEKKKKNKKKANSGYYRSIVSLCFLFMGLLGLIFYGKICGILCTSMWLFSAPLWTSVGDHYGSARKKKLVTRGLLARDNRTTIHSQ